MPRKTIYTPEVVKFILQKSHFYSYRSIAELIKKEFGLPATIAGVKGVMRRTPHEIKPRVYTSCKSFPDYVQDYIAFMCVYYTDFELSKNLSELFDIKCTPNNIRQWRQRRQIKTGRTGGELTADDRRCIEGRIKKGQHISRKTEFKKGHVPSVVYPAGCKRLRSDGYYKIKIDGKWFTYSRYIWEKHYGPIPEGCVLIHLDGNKGNDDLNNLRLVKKSVIPVSRDKMIKNNVEFNNCIVSIIEIEQKIKIK